jgi:Bacterial PH domain
MAITPNEYGFPQTAKKFMKALWKASRDNTDTLWQLIVQDTDGSLPIRARKHWIVLLAELLPTVAFSILVLWAASMIEDPSWRGLQWFLWCVAFAAIPYLTWIALKWFNEVLTVTRYEIRKEEGVFEPISKIIRITQMATVEFRRPLLGWMLGYVTLKIISSGHQRNVETFKYLPKQFKPVIEEQL